MSGGELNPVYDAADAQFLTGLVVRFSEQYDNGDVSGLASHSVSVDPATGVQVLAVRFESADGVTLEGEWSLTLLSVVKSGGVEDE